MSAVAGMMALTGSLSGAGDVPLTLTFLGGANFNQTNALSNKSFSALSGGNPAPTDPFYLIGVVGAENITTSMTFTISGLTLTSHAERIQTDKSYVHFMGTTTTLTSLPSTYSITVNSTKTARSAVAWYAITGASSASPATTGGATATTASGPTHSVSVNAGDLVITAVAHENDQTLVVRHDNVDVTDARYSPNTTNAVAFGSSVPTSAGTLAANATGPAAETGQVAIATAVYR